MADNKAVNKDLDNLLDSALSDFDANAAAPPALPKDEAVGGDEDVKFNFDDLKKTMQSIMKQEPELLEQLKSAGAGGTTAGGEFDFSKAMEESLAMFAESFDKINETLKRPEPSADGDDGLAAMILDNLHSLLSRDLIYPGIKDLETKYPQWLEDHRETLSTEDLTRFEAQLEVTKKICTAFEEENETDTDEEKSSRLDGILSMLTDLQKLGHPPTDLVAPVDEIPAMPEGCNPQ